MMSTDPHQQTPFDITHGDKDTKNQGINYEGISALHDPQAWEESPDDTQDEQWPQPQPIEKPLPPVDAMPDDILPDALERWLADIAHRMQVPMEFTTVAAISMVGSIVGNQIGIRPKEKDNWLEVPNLWGCVVGTPSMLKTPTIKEIMKPIGGLEKKAADEHSAAMLDYKAKGERKKIELDAIKKKGKGGSKNLDEMENDIKELMRDEEPPTRKRYLSNDATTEKLGIILNGNPKGILVFRDELSGLLASWNKSGREQDRAFYLEAWSGQGSFTVDRVGRPDLFVKHLCLSVFGGIQPAKLAGYFNDISSYGNDGMMQRFQLTVYPDPVKREYVDKYPDTMARERAYKVVEGFADFDYQTLGKHDRFEPIPYLNFAADAQPVFKQWLIDLEALLQSEELTPLLEEHFAKYRSLVPSLALLFHLIDYAAGTTDARDVTLSALEKAIRFTEFLKSHAKRIYSLFGDGKQYAAYELSKRIAKGDLGESFKASDVARKGWHSLDKTDKVVGAVGELIDADWLIEQQAAPNPQGGRPEAPTYFINPHTLNFYKKA